MNIAFESGYYDHAHFTNDIKRYTTTAPTNQALTDFSKTVTEQKYQSLFPE